jgi:hypothetical protein
MAPGQLHGLGPSALLFLAACSGGDMNQGQECGPEGTCPVRYTCDPADNHCKLSASVGTDAGADGMAPPDGPGAASVDAASADAVTTTQSVTITGGLVAGAVGVACPSPTFTYAATPGGPDVAFQCGLVMGPGPVTEGDLAACPPSGKSYSDLVGGATYTFAARTIGGPLTSATFVVDGAGPAISVTSPTGTTGAQVAVVFTVTAATAATFTCQVDGATPVACTSGQTISSIAPGPHMLTVTGTDACDRMGAGQSSFDVVLPALGASTTTINGATYAQCLGQTGSNTQSHDDVPPAVTATGAFNAAVKTAPADAVTSCSAGSGTDRTSGTWTSAGTIDPATGTLTLTQVGQGMTTAQSAYTGNPQVDSCLDIGDGLNASTKVAFTLAATTPFTFTGTASATDPTFLHYSLVRVSPTSATIFDQSLGSTPSLDGTLPAGGYQVQVTVGARNDVACQKTTTATDSFAVDLKLAVHP